MQEVGAEGAIAIKGRGQLVDPNAGGEVPLRASAPNSMKRVADKNKFGADWELPWHPTPPLDLSIEAANGQTVTALQALKQDGTVGPLPTQVQFSINNPAATAMLLSNHMRQVQVLSLGPGSMRPL
eukprot:jgi/Astpho2/4482/Aster-x1251